MITKASQPSALSEYISLQLRLHRLIRQGKGEGSEAEEIRDQMDGCWNAMTQVDHDLAREIANDLGSIEKISKSKKLTPTGLSTLRRVEEFADLGGWEHALGILRSKSTGIPASQAIALKGLFWGKRGQFEAAREFFDTAQRIDPTNEKVAILLLESLRDTENVQQSIDLALSVLERSNRAETALRCAEFLLEIASRIRQESTTRTALFAAEKGIELGKKDVQNKDIYGLTLKTLLWVTLLHWELGDRVAAKLALGSVLALDPENALARIIEGWLSVDTPPMTPPSKSVLGFNTLITAIDVPLPIIHLQDS